MTVQCVMVSRAFGIPLTVTAAAVVVSDPAVLTSPSMDTLVRLAVFGRADERATGRPVADDLRRGRRAAFAGHGRGGERCEFRRGGLRARATRPSTGHKT